MRLNLIPVGITCTFKEIKISIFMYVALKRKKLTLKNSNTPKIIYAALRKHN